MFVDKNAILSWEWARVIVRIRCDRGVSKFQKLFDARTAFVNDRRIVKINDMRPSMILEPLAAASFHPLKTAVQAVESLCFYILSQARFF